MTGSTCAKSSKFDKGEYYDTFFLIRSIFNNVGDNEYSKYLHENDQVLRNIGMYLVENYKNAYSYCEMSADCKERCEYLNKWLNEKQALYTSNGKCTYNDKLWAHYIEELWKQLENESGKEEKCERVKTNREFHEKLLNNSCKNGTPVEMPRNCPEPVLPKEKPCQALMDPTSSSCKAVLTTTYVVFGILLFAMYLLRFSSVGMKINNLIRGRKLKGRNVDNETDESFRNNDNYNMESLDGRFHVIYNSLQNS
ncbi:PIR protein [Plasmodium ovale]|uniref:PIR protein n=1 Tax=Plasmodium ovale TaxID=36330 RepID=A0A1C3KIZ4_PLAOA|nr:PIR protein [Plasmodium ovale]